MTARDYIKQDMLRQIRDGAWRVGECIPTLDRLEHAYPYSRRTISLAVSELMRLGILGTRGKAGTVVHCMPGNATVGILVNYGLSTRINTDFAYSLSDRLQWILHEAGHGVRMYHETPGFLDKGALPSQVLLEDVGRKMLAGLVTVASNLPVWERRHPDRKLDLPVVNISYHPCDYRVYVDLEGGIDAGVEALAATGRKAVGMIGRPYAEAADRFAERVAAAGLETRPEWIFSHKAEVMNEVVGYEGLRQIWQAGSSRPEALFIPDDIVAKGVAQAALTLSIRVPEELVLIYQQNEGIEHFYPVPMRRTCLPLSEMVTSSVALLEQVMANRHGSAVDIRVKPRVESADDFLTPKEVNHA